MYRTSRNANVRLSGTSFSRTVNIHHSRSECNQRTHRALKEHSEGIERAIKALKSESYSRSLKYCVLSYRCYKLQPSFQAYYTYGQDSNNYYSDYGYQLPQEASLNPFSLTQERTGGLEAFLTAPLVVTAFIAALFGGK